MNVQRSCGLVLIALAILGCSGGPSSASREPSSARDPRTLKSHTESSRDRSLANRNAGYLILQADKSLQQSLAIGSSLDAVTFSVVSAPTATFAIVAQNCADFFTLTGAVLSSAAMAADKQACYVRIQATLGKQTSTMMDVSVMLTTKSAYISSGFFHSCAIDGGGAVVCWGDNSFGQKNVPSGAFSSVVAGKYHSCGIVKDSGEVQCWGAGTSASVSGEYPNFGQSTPPAGIKAVALAAGGYHTCAITTGGGVTCWGAGSGRAHQAAVPHFGQSAAPSFSARSISAGEYHTCVVTNDSRVKCWGAGMDKEILGFEAQQSLPPQGLTDVLFVAAGARHSCAAQRAGNVVCWGENSHGQAPVASVAFAASVQSISAGYLNTCVVLANNDVRCFGAGLSGTSFPNFGQSANGSAFLSISAGAFHTCGISTGGSVSCWGALAANDAFYGRGQSVAPSLSVP